MSEQSETKGERTRARIIQAAHHVFIECGYHGASMRQIAEQAELALGGIYNHFSGKEDIFSAVMIEYNPYRAIAQAMDAARGETVEELVRNAAAGMLAALTGRPDSLHLMFIGIVEFGGRHFPQLFDLILPQVTGFAQRLVQAEGSLRQIPPPILIRAFVGFFFSYFMTEWFIGAQYPPELEQRAFDDFVNIYLHGILAE